MPFKIIGGLNVDRDSMMGMLIVSYDRACTREESARSSLLSGRRISCNGRVRKMERWAFLAAHSGQYQSSELHQKGGRTTSSGIYQHRQRTDLALFENALAEVGIVV